VGGWLAPGSLQHINAGALRIYANGIGILKIYFLEYRMPQAENHIPSKARQKKSCALFESAQNKIVSQKKCQIEGEKNGRSDLYYCIRNS
jgi:hypothetical protein